MKAKFVLSYARTTPESAENGDYSDCGILADGLTLREALHTFGNFADEADNSPLSRRCPPRWFTRYRGTVDYATGETEELSLHLPRTITPSSAMRMARLLRVA